MQSWKDKVPTLQGSTVLVIINHRTVSSSLMEKGICNNCLRSYLGVIIFYIWGPCLSRVLKVSLEWARGTARSHIAHRGPRMWPSTRHWTTAGCVTCTADCLAWPGVGEWSWVHWKGRWWFSVFVGFLLFCVWVFFFFCLILESFYFFYFKVKEEILVKF